MFQLVPYLKNSKTNKKEKLRKKQNKS